MPSLIAYWYHFSLDESLLPMEVNLFSSFREPPICVEISHVLKKKIFDTEVYSCTAIRLEWLCIDQKLSLIKSYYCIILCPFCFLFQLWQNFPFLVLNKTPHHGSQYWPIITASSWKHYWHCLQVKAQSGVTVIYLGCLYSFCNYAN